MNNFLRHLKELLDFASDFKAKIQNQNNFLGLIDQMS